MFKQILNLLIITVALTLTQAAFAQVSDDSNAQQAAKSQSYFEKTQQVGDLVWIGPQPTEADFSELAALETGAVINTRTAAEMQTLDFKEVEAASKYNITYDLLEIGKGHNYSPAKLTEFNTLMEAHAGKNILLHCRSGNRAKQLYTAWLIKHQDKTPAEALKAVGSTETELNDSVKLLLGH